jgi:heat shock protein HslJ
MSEAGGGRLPGTSWSLTSLGGRPSVRGTTITLNFGTDGKATGTDGCNSYVTPYTSDATTVKFQSPGASTLMACPAPVMDQASAYTKALGQAATYRIDGQQLTLSDSGGKELAVFAAQSSDLAGTNWNVTGYNNGKQAVVSVIIGTTITANFDTAGKVSGSGGCNMYSATYTSDGKSTINIGPAVSTRKACAEPQGVMEQETQYLAALSTAATYGIDGNRMEMRTTDGAIAVSFAK